MQTSYSLTSFKLNRTDKEVIDFIESGIGSEADCAIPNGFAAAFIGTMYRDESETWHAVYSKQLMTEVLMIEDKMSYDEAVEFLNFNTWNAYPPQGSHPVYIDTID